MKTAEAPSPVHIGKVVRNAVLFNFRDPRGATVSDSALLDAVDRLFALLDERRIDYLLVGGIALLQYVEGRNTEDIDLILEPSALEKLPEIRIMGGEQDFAHGTFDGLEIDLRLTSHPLFDTVRQRYRANRPFVERQIPCATVEGLLILKLFALPSLYRQGNLVRVALYETDVLTLLHRYHPEIEPLFLELTPHLGATDLAALRQVVGEIQAKIARFGKGFIPP